VSVTTPGGTTAPSDSAPADGPSASVAVADAANVDVGFWAAVRSDHAALGRAEQRYSGRGDAASRWIVADLVRNIGFQMLFAYRFMRLFRRLHLTPLAMVTSRLIRHLYSAELHWETVIAPGVVIVHGNGLVLSREATVGAGCILFQSVTLGMSVDSVSRQVGGPTLESDVHVGPGAALLGPITVGRGSKVMANAVLMTSVPAGSIVEVPTAVVRSRTVR
jgi:serine O-acetyltransferase